MIRTVMQRPNGGALFTAVLLATTTMAAADVPRLIQFQGKLVGSNGAALEGPVDLRFRLYGDEVNPTPLLFDETHSAVTLTRGLFSILVGSNTGGGVPDAAVAAPTVYIGVTVDTGPELAPRRQIVTAPYTFKARSAEVLVKPGSLDAAVSVDPQGRVAVGAGSPSSAAALDVASTTGGFLPPRMTTAQRDAIGSPDEGLMIFNADTGCLNMRLGNVWRVFGAPDTPGAITGPNDVCSGSTGVAYSVGDVPGAASFQWEVPPGSTVASGQGSAFISVDFGPLSGSVSVKAANGCGTSAANTLPMVVSGSPPSTPSEILGPQFPIQGSDAQYSVPAVFGATSYTWTLPSGWTLLSGQGNNSISATVGPPGGNIAVTANNACGSSSPRTMSGSTVIPLTNLTTSPTTMGYTGSLAAVRVPAGVTSMTIEAWGAEGGNGAAGAGGKGARMRGTVSVTPGEVLRVIVGQRPPSGNNGGGGGSFVTRVDYTPLVIAGGGGGNAASDSTNKEAVTSTTGQNGGGSSFGVGGQNGNGGAASPQGGGGGGLLTDGGTGGGQEGGKAFVNGGRGGANGGVGGFGGGGSGTGSSGAGGGGAGYSGGGAADSFAGGGGGSFNSGSNQSNSGSVQLGDGQVVFTW